VSPTCSARLLSLKRYRVRIQVVSMDSDGADTSASTGAGGYVLSTAPHRTVPHRTAPEPRCADPFTGSSTLLLLLADDNQLLYRFSARDLLCQKQFWISNTETTKTCFVNKIAEKSYRTFQCKGTIFFFRCNMVWSKFEIHWISVTPLIK